MKLRYHVLLVGLCASFAQASDIVITGVFDGPLTGGVPKGVELFVINDIADLSRCGIGSANNGDGSGGQELTFSAVAATAGSYIYVASESPQFTAFFGFSPTYTGSAASINGDDAIELFCDGAVIDVFGDTNVDGTNQPWDYLDGWAYRTADTGPDGSSFVLANWTFSGTNQLEGGSTNETTNVPFPLKNYAEGTNNGSDGDPVDDPTAGGCVGCDPITKVADATSFDAASYYAAVQAEVDATTPAAVIKPILTDTISTGHSALTYSQVWTALTFADEDPNNSNNVILWYKGTSRAKNLNGGDSGDWNREHTWPQSHGFKDINGAKAYTDVHHLRASDVAINGLRGDLDFDNGGTELGDAAGNFRDSDSFEPRNDIKGDVARAVFYMDTRYEGYGGDVTPDLQLVDHLTSSSSTELGLLCRLWEWHVADPVDAKERTRNDVVYEFQGNRNPYIDHPEWAEIFYKTNACGSDDGEPGDGGDDGDAGGNSTQGDLFISEYVEASFGNNKAIELFNPTDRELDLSTASYVLSRFTNGSSSVSGSVNLTGVVPPMSTFVIAHTSAVDEIKNVADMLSGQIQHNGDDAYILYKDGEVLDSFGRVGEDPGAAWGTGSTATIDNSLVRKATINHGDVVTDNEFDPAQEWISVGKDVFSNLGRHDYQAPEIFISEYVEGGGSNKAIEIYNPAFASVDLAAGNYVLSLFSNGATSPSLSYSFTSTIAANDVFVVVNPSSVQALKDVADDTSGSINHNGDDAYVLYKDGVIIDSFGRVGERMVWGSGDTSSQNHTLVRKASVAQGDIVENDIFDPATQWDGFAQDTFEYLGSHNSSNDGGDPGDGDVELGQCADPATLISAIQGSASVSLLVNQTHVVEAVVTASLPALSGFFVQEQTEDMDNNSQTSEGLFVYYSAALPPVGSVVRIVGKVEEYFEKTQLNVNQAYLDCGVDSLAATSFSLPFADSDAAEALEGMLVEANEALVVSDNYNLGHFGEVTLSNGRLYNPTNLFVPGPDVDALVAQNALNQIILDDGMNGADPVDVIYPTGGLSAANTLRGGDTVSSLVGVMDFSFSNYRVIPTIAPTFVATNARTASPQVALGNLKVASLNVLNYFTTLDLPGVTPDPRGADSAQELARQKAKTLAAIIALDADIIGLMEIENNGVGEGSALNDLVEGLNAQLGANTYMAVDTGVAVGTDQITTALIYKSASVNLSGSVMINNNSVFSRPPIAQTFALTSNRENVTVVVNHFKSKSCGSANGLDADQNDGQGCYNNTRVQQAQALATWLATDASLSQQSRQLIIGDLNAYAKENPITTLEAAGFTNLVEHFQGAEAYSYSFNGTVGYLDHALASADLLAVAIDTNDWHINSDEPIVLDYNTEDKTPAQIDTFFAPDQYRMSDHDPVVMTFQLSTPALRGDWDGDGDVDIDDIRAFTLAIQKRLPIDMAFDLNNDGVVNALDTRAMKLLCTRSGCAA